MADRRRAELAETVSEACEAVADVGFCGLMEIPVLKVFTELQRLNDTEHTSNLLSALDEAATRTVSSRAPPGFPELMVLSQVLLDIEGPAAPPSGSPLESEFKSLAAHLRLALCVALQQFARPGSEEAKQGLQMASGMLLMLHDKVQGDAMLTLAVEHALSRLLFRSKSAVLLLRDRSWALSALAKQVEALKDYNPDAEGADNEEEPVDAEEDGEEEDGDEGEDEEEGDMGEEEGAEDEEEPANGAEDSG